MSAESYAVKYFVLSKKSITDKISVFVFVKILQNTCFNKPSEICTCVQAAS